MADLSPSTLTVLNSNFLQLGRSGGRPQQTVHPRQLPVSTVIHTTLAGIEPTTFRLLVRRATSSATDSPSQKRVIISLKSQCKQVYNTYLDTANALNPDGFSPAVGT